MKLGSTSKIIALLQISTLKSSGWQTLENRGIKGVAIPRTGLSHQLSIGIRREVRNNKRGNLMVPYPATFGWAYCNSHHYDQRGTRKSSGL